MSMLEYALEYARMGFSIFPLAVRDKTPLTKNGFKNASNDEIQIKEWWTKWPDANIAVACGAMSGGLCIIDMDIDEDKGENGVRIMDDWQRRHGALKPSWMARTGRGGWHYFFRADGPIKNRVKFMPGVDVRGDGGYAVLPPSVHPNGNTYQWLERFTPSDVDLHDIDDTIRFLLSTGEQKPTAVYYAPEKIPQGERNHMLFKFACMMQAKGASDQAVFAATDAENQSKCDPPLSYKEVQTIVKSALRYDKGKTIYVDNSGNASQGQREPVFDLAANGKIKPTWDNIREAIEYDPALYGKIRTNELMRSVFVYGALPWDSTNTYRPWANSDDACLKSYLEKRYGFGSTEKIMDALLIVAERNKFNPITDELERIHAEFGACDGAIKALLPTYMGVVDNEYQYEVLKTYMLGAISRAYYPGCKFDYSIILYGAQGFGKSEFLRHLAICSEWFNDNFNTFDGDKAIEKLTGMWIVEMAELKALKSAKDAESFKSFLTSRVDTYRAPYARRSEQRPRMCVFAGTTNNKNVFVDKTGNRRFLPIECRKGYETKSLFGDQEEVCVDFQKAWAEAMELFEKADRHPQLILCASANKAAEAMQAEFSEEDYRVGMIQNWLDATDASKVCVPMLIEYALCLELARVPKQQRREIQEIMENEIEGWTRVKTKDKGRMGFGKYGSQIAFIREPS